MIIYTAHAHSVFVRFVRFSVNRDYVPHAFVMETQTDFCEILFGGAPVFTEPIPILNFMSTCQKVSSDGLHHVSSMLSASTGRDGLVW